MEAKDVGSTSFGLIIAYLLPGFAGMFAISFWAPPVRDLFSQFIEAESNVGRFLLVILCSLVVGLEVSVLRWLLFEKILCRKHQRDHSKYRHLSTDSKLSAFRAAVDENYRYHQFWGGMAVVTPFIGWGLVTATGGFQAYELVGAFFGIEVLNIAGGCSAYRNYIDRTHKILEGLQDDERVGTDGRRTRNEERSSSSPATTSSSQTAPSTTEAATEKVADNSCEVTAAETPP